MYYRFESLQILDTVEEVTEDVNVEELKSGASADNKDDINVIIDYLHSDILKIKKVKTEDLDSKISEEEAVFDYDLNLKTKMYLIV